MKPTNNNASKSLPSVTALAQNWRIHALCLLAFVCLVPAANAQSELPELDCVIEPSEIVDIGSASAGVLEVVSFDRGDPVVKNQVVARLESGTEKAAAELARVRSEFNTGIELRRTSAEFFNRNQERSRSLTEQNAISKQQLDQLGTEAIVAELQVRQEQDNKQLANLEYRRARQALNRRTIKSPIDGVVMERFRSVGEYIEDTAIMRVAQLNPLHIETIVPVSHMGTIKTGMQARVTPVVPGEPAEYAIVTRIDRVADAASGTFGVRLELANPDHDIVSGVRCALEFTGKTLTAEQQKKSLALDKKAKRAAQASAKQVNATNNKEVSVSKNENFSAQASGLKRNTGDLPQCFEAGPFTERAVAASLIQKFAERGDEARLREVAGEHAGQYFVLTKKSSDSAAAKQQVAELRQKGIDDMHLLRRGPHTGSISLGLFNNRESADKKQSHFNARGIDVHVAARSPDTLWLDITTSAAMDSSDVRRMLSANVPAQVSDVSCATLQSYVK